MASWPPLPEAAGGGGTDEPRDDGGGAASAAGLRVSPAVAPPGHRLVLESAIPRARKEGPRGGILGSCRGEDRPARERRPAGCDFPLAGDSSCHASHVEDIFRACVAEVGRNVGSGSDRAPWVGGGDGETSSTRQESLSREGVG